MCDITLTEPFPKDRLPDFHHWLASYATIARGGTVPEADTFGRLLSGELRALRSWAAWREERLFGVLLLEPCGQKGARAYVASARWAWGKGYLDIAAKAAIGQAFQDDPDLEYIFGVVMEKNAPAKAFNRRIGMRLKNLFLEQLYRVYEITRDQWIELNARTGLSSASCLPMSGPAWLQSTGSTETNSHQPSTTKP